jgi:hypothetical protein
MFYWVLLFLNLAKKIRTFYWRYFWNFVFGQKSEILPWSLKWSKKFEFLPWSLSDQKSLHEKR